MNEFEDIEQMLKPQCEFKASDTLKQEVMEKARQEIRPRRTIKLWPWVAAACVIGFIMMILMPPKSVTEDEPLVAKMETPNVVEEQQEEKTPEPAIVKVETPKQRKNTQRRSTSTQRRSTSGRLLPTGSKNRPRCVKPQKEPVQMSEETRKELLLAMSSQNDDMPQMEDIDIEEEIRQMRQRGEQMISMYEENDK